MVEFGIKFGTLSAAGLLLLLAGCATEMGEGESGSFSTCNMSQTSEQIRWCLAGENSEDLFRASGRHKVIYSRFNNLPDLAKEGLSACLTERDDQSSVNACRPDEVLKLAEEAIPFDEASTCEAVMDPRKSLMGC